MTLLSKISAKGENDLRSLGELIPGLPRGSTKPVDHKVSLGVETKLNNNIKLTLK